MPIALSEIDAVLSSRPGFRIVNRFKIDESGVDPLGLRQLNLDIMDAAVPGINNVTKFIRPYAFMTWAWWKAGKVASEGGFANSAVMSDLVARYEVMYMWAHALIAPSIRGAATIRAHLPLKDSKDEFLFRGSQWEEVKKKYTSFMAPTEYGPSIKALRWLMPEQGGVFIRSREVEDAISTIENIVRSSIPERLLSQKAPSATWQDIQPLAHKLNVSSPSKAEREAFRLLFYDAGTRPEAPREIRRRMATIDLLLAILPDSGEFIDIFEIRRRLASGKIPDGANGKDPHLLTSSFLLTILQARQLQRLATEAMMLWIERSLSTEVASAKTTEELAGFAQQDAERNDNLVSETRTIGEYMDRVEDSAEGVDWPAAAAREETDITNLMVRLFDAQRKDISHVPALALRAFAIVYAITKAFRRANFSEVGFDPIESRPDRLPMGIMTRRIDTLRDKPLTSLWRDVIESWVIAQHVHWSAIRGIDGKKRLRIGLEGRGWIRVRSKPSTVFRATPDRLLTLLSLGTECGLFTRSGTENPRFGRPF
jgi:hypothetical protein